jgi:hypothetical protein
MAGRGTLTGAAWSMAPDAKLRVGRGGTGFVEGSRNGGPRRVPAQTADLVASAVEIGECFGYEAVETDAPALARDPRVPLILLEKSTPLACGLPHLR